MATPSTFFKTPSWFSFDSISSTEERYLKENYFNKIKSSARIDQIHQTWKDCRDWMIKAYQADPKKDLTVNVCRPFLGDDVLFLSMVLEFLEHHQLINLKILKPSNSLKRKRDEDEEVVPTSKRPKVNRNPEQVATPGAGAGAGAGSETEEVAGAGAGAGDADAINPDENLVDDDPSKQT